MNLHELSDDDLVLHTEAVHLEGQRLLARLLVHLVEIENRRLELRRAFSSLFDFCRRKLGMSDSEAYRRITAARLVRKFPALVPLIERGATHLSILVLLKHHLTADNFTELMAATCGKSKREVQTLLAERAPKPDVPSSIEALPATSPQSTIVVGGGALLTEAARPPAPPTRVEPLAPQRHLVQFTVSTETRDKLEYARDLLRHANPSGDLGDVVDRALTLLIAKLEKDKQGKTEKPKAPRTSTKRTRHIPKHVERAVWERDAKQCTYVGPNGERCPSTTYLEIEHKTPFALGGENTLENLCLRCRPHNQLLREQIFGKEIPAKSKSVPKVVVADTRIEAHPLDPASRARATRGLLEMGFTHRDVSRALETVDANHAKDGPPPLVDAIREAIRILTA